MTKRICDLPPKLVGEKILTKVPITSLREVRSTCKLWDRLSKDWILGKAAAARPHQFLGFMTMDFKVCSLRFDLGRKEDDEEEEDLVLSIKQVDLLSQVEIERVFHCDGLLLCVARGSSRLVVWNPYLGQTRWIAPRTYFHYFVNYAVGYDMNRNHKILMFWDGYDRDGEQLFGLEIYDLPSNSWRVLEFRPDWEVEGGHRGVSLKGNTYFWAHEKGVDYDYDDFLLCFDFTTERFGQRLRLPFHSWDENVVTLSSVRDEKLAVLHQKGVETIKALEIWITTKIEPNDVTWSKFMNVDMRPLIGDRDVRFDELYGSFFIDEEKKVAVVFDVDGYEFAYELIKTAHYHTAFIIGDDGYYKTVSHGEAPNLWKPLPGSIYCYPTNYTPQVYSPPLVCSSSYLPSLVQLNQPRKRKERHEC